MGEGRECKGVRTEKEGKRRIEGEMKKETRRKGRERVAGCYCRGGGRGRGGKARSKVEEEYINL